MRLPILISLSGLILLGLLGACGSPTVVQSPTATPTSTPVSSTEFISVWKTDNFGVSTTSNQIELPFESGGVYNCDVDWGDGNTNHITTWNDPATIHTYSAFGTYTIKISGTVHGFNFSRKAYNDKDDNPRTAAFGDSQKLLSIEKWGPLELGNNGYYFAHCCNLSSTGSDLLSLLGTTNLSHMFYYCTSLSSVPYIGSWAMQNVVDTSYMFCPDSLFNEAIGSWDTSNVNNMDWMLSSASAFNQAIGNWNTSKVTSMSGMFAGAITFNQPIGNWDMSKVAKINCMFQDARTFNQAIGGWNTSNIVDMSQLFQNAKAFNKSIGSWDTSKVEKMAYLFQGASAFNQTIVNWNVSKVTDISYMFDHAISFNQPLNGWDVSRLASALSAFNGASAFNQPLNAWNTSRLLQITDMFQNTSSFDQSLGTWNIENVHWASNFLTGSKTSVINYDSLLIGWAKRTVQSGVQFEARSIKYSSAGSVARASLVNRGWIIYDGGMEQ